MVTQNALLSPSIIADIRAEDIKRCFCLTSDVCRSRTLGITREQRPRKTKIGAQVPHVTHDSDTTFKVKGSKVKITSPVYSPRRLRTGSCSGQRGNIFSVGNCCYLAVRLGGEKRFGAHRGRRGAGTYRDGRPPAYSLF